MAHVVAIRTAPEASAPMVERESVRAVADGGLRGDRYCRGTGHYSPYDVCQATFVDRADLEAIREEHDIDLTDGRHRRNVELSGVDVLDLLSTRFRIGEAVFEGTRRRPPCPHVEGVAGEEGVARALKRDRGGICADVVEGGEFAVDDEVTIVERLDDPDSLAAAIRERVGE